MVRSKFKIEELHQNRTSLLP